MRSFDFFELLYLFSALHGFFLVSILLLRSKYNRANLFLSLLLGLFSFNLLEQAFSLNGAISDYPHLLYTTVPLTYLFGPAYYHFIRSSFRPKSKLKWVHLCHLIPFVLVLIVFVPFLLLPGDQKLQIYEANRSQTWSWEWNLSSFIWLVYMVSTAIFLWLAWNIVRKTKKENSSLRKIKLLKNGSLVLLGYMGFSICLSILITFFPNLSALSLHLNLIPLVIILHSIAYLAFLYPELTNGKLRQKKYRTSPLSIAQIGPLKEKLNDLMDKGELYLNPELQLEDLAKALDISKAHASQLLSEGMETNFYKLVNSYRVEKAKSLLHSTQYQNAKIIHIGIDSGFSNKSSFERNFKQITGSSPSTFRKKNLN